MFKYFTNLKSIKHNHVEIAKNNIDIQKWVHIKDVQYEEIVRLRKFIDVQKSEIDRLKNIIDEMKKNNVISSCENNDLTFKKNGAK